MAEAGNIPGGRVGRVRKPSRAVLEAQESEKAIAASSDTFTARNDGSYESDYEEEEQPEAMKGKR
jgi:hypothetical protein